MASTGIFHHAFLHHHLGAPDLLAVGLEVGRAFLGGLEDELHAAGQLVLHAGQHLGRGHQDGGVRVVAAGVHHVHFLAQVGALGLGREGQVHLFLHRQRVHVGAQHHRTGLAALEHGDHAGHGHAGLHLHAQRAQMVGHQLGGARFLVAQFRMLVDVAAPGDELVLDGLGALVDLRGQRRIGRGRQRPLGAGRALRRPAGPGQVRGQGQRGKAEQDVAVAHEGLLFVGLRVALVVVNVCPLTCYWPPSLPERRRVVARCYRCLRIGVLNSGP